MSTSDALLVGGNLVSFGAGISQDLRDDILDCLLYAQLSADKKHDRGQGWKRWIEQYQRVILQKGSQLTGAINPTSLTIKRLSDLRYLPLNPTGTATSPQLRALMRTSLDMLLKSGHAQTFFNTWFSSGRSENFQVVPCEMDEQGGVTILVCGLQMTTTALSQNFFFWQALAGEMTVRSNGASFRLTAQSYEPYRKPIRDYLADNALRKILEL
ncbi:MAG TPA: hypothetical protein VGC62_04545 [Pseudomonas sp.]|uniref:hypothetical protein n=1 Tax=Pseudomonas sp. TaxID=306 RepID=UPI002EDAC750